MKEALAYPIVVTFVVGSWAPELDPLGYVIVVLLMPWAGLVLWNASPFF